MSADAGLRTYADAMQEADDLGTGGGDQTVAPRLTYHDLCQPSAIIQHRAASTRFWRESVQTYRAATLSGSAGRRAGRDSGPWHL